MVLDLQRPRRTAGLLGLLLLPLAGLGCDRGPWTRWDETLQMPVGVAPSELPDPDSRGARLEARYCSQCHGIPSPKMHGAADWTPVVRRMIQRMEHSGRMGPMMGRGRGGWMPRGMHGAEAPAPAERREILAYLQDHALDEIRASELPGPASAARTRFGSVCSQCHALPDPGQHTAPEWPDVVERMKNHMSEYGLPVPADGELEEILGYLRDNAASE